MQLKPGLSAYAKDPKAAALSLEELLQKAEAVVPRELRGNTPVKVGVSDLYGLCIFITRISHETTMLLHASSTANF